LCYRGRTGVTRIIKKQTLPLINTDGTDRILSGIFHDDLRSLQARGEPKRPGKNPQK
jgi:hypothetical protein